MLQNCLFLSIKSKLEILNKFRCCLHNKPIKNQNIKLCILTLVAMGKYFTIQSVYIKNC